jgi:hypothetical protein
MIAATMNENVVDALEYSIKSLNTALDEGKCTKKEGRFAARLVGPAIEKAMLQPNDTAVQEKLRELKNKLSELNLRLQDS